MGNQPLHEAVGNMCDSPLSQTWVFLPEIKCFEQPYSQWVVGSGVFIYCICILDSNPLEGPKLLQRPKGDILRGPVDTVFRLVKRATNRKNQDFEKLP